MKYDSTALTGGQWRANHRGIQVWWPDADVLTEMPTPAFDPDEIACHCGATVTTACRSKTGGSRSSHAYRTPRRCRCGGELAAPRRQVCSDCARETELAAKRTASKRHYAARKSAA